VQSNGCLITQKLEQSKGASEMIVWLSREGLTQPEEADGIVLVEAERAYAAVRVVKGGYTWLEGRFESDRNIREGATMILKEEDSPVILEIMAKSDVESFEAFKAKVKVCDIDFDGALLTYTSIYGDQLTLDTSGAAIPTINGESVDYAPKMVFESPFLNAVWNSGVVTISKGEREKVLDFTQD
jgi:hypothetical protein